MSRSPCLTLLVAAVAVGFFSSSSPAADDALLGRGVQKLFDVGWDTSVKARGESGQVAQKIDELFPGDVRGDYAYVLVLTKQRRYADAAKRMKQIVAADDDDIHYWMTSIRLDMLTKQYASALAGMERLGQLIPETPAPTAAEEDPHRETAVFLGRMFGYLQGPIEGEVSQESVDAAKDRVEARLGEARSPAFEDGWRRVREKFSALTLEKEDTLAEEREEAEKEQQRLLAEVAEEKDGLDPKRDSLRQDQQKLRDDARQRIDELTEDERPLLAQLNQIQSQAMLVRRQLSIAVSNLNSAQLAMNNERDPIVRSQIGGQLSNFNVIAARYEAQLNLLERRAFLINRQRALMRRRVGQSQASIASEIASIEKELGELDKREKRLDVQERKGSKSPVVISRSVRALEAELAAFTTYDEFPLEREKQRVLDWFRY